MESQEIIDSFREQIDQVEKQGDQQIPVVALKNYLKALEKDAGKSQEYRNREHAGMLAQYVAKNQYSIEMLKAVLEAGKSALHALLIINGGAVIALLGVFSNLAGKEGTKVLAMYLALPLLQFGIGVLLAAVGFATRYLSQACYSGSLEAKDKMELYGDGFRNLAIFVAVSGYILFGFAVANSYSAVLWSFK